jgi:hypothetical protein
MRASAGRRRLTFPASAASVINVATTGTDTPGCGASAAPCATIQFAYGEALAGDASIDAPLNW